MCYKCLYGHRSRLAELHDILYRRRQPACSTIGRRIPMPKPLLLAVLALAGIGTSIYLMLDGRYTPWLSLSIGIFTGVMLARVVINLSSKRLNRH